MIRALYTAASGMNAQQASIDNVAHNLANVNTAGYKRSHVEFEDLFYQHTRVPGAATSLGDQPVGLEVGLGTRVVATSRDFTNGSFRATGSPLDMAIQGQGFFRISMPDGTQSYTRSGAFQRDAQGQIVTSDGYALDPQISIPENATSVSISREGVVSASIPGQSAAQQLGTIELTTFQNPSGLTPMGSNLFQVTSASGEPQTGPAGTEQRGTLTQGYLEDSNVSVVEEMVNMILGQRAYEASSKVIKAADEMLAQVNNIVR
jgi:flagellar basal-body rod protein FlgG